MAHGTATDRLDMTPQDGSPSQAAFYALAALNFSEESMTSVMERVAVLTKETVPGASEVSVTLVEDREAFTVAFTGQLAVDLDERQYEQDAGPCLSCITDGEPVVIERMGSDERWPDWAQAAVRHGARSSLSIPVPLQPSVSAALNLYSTQERAFDDEAVDIAKAFASYAAVALANMQLYEAQGKVAEQLQAAMQSRAVIEQAKGIIMGERLCSAEDAFEILVDLSQRSNRKLRDVAQALVAQAVPKVEHS
jgi:GAF domain-containing protein